MAAAVCREAVTEARSALGLGEGGRLTVETVRILRLVLGPVQTLERQIAVARWVETGSSSSDWYSVCPAHCGPASSKARSPLGAAGPAACAWEVTKKSA